jgi:hypothetical protein
MCIGNPCLLWNIVMWWSLLTILGVLLVLALATRLSGTDFSDHQHDGC